jgi:hypothetical protein
MQCHYQIDIGNVDQCGCRSPRIVTAGVVPKQWCDRCPVREEPRAASFFEQTSTLLIQKTLTGEYKPVSKSCGGCSTVKRRDGAVQFVWPYWHAGANGDEIRWSVRSVETMFQGQCKITIIGDKPPWYHGHFIPKKRVPAHTPNRSYRDMLSKVWVMATHAEIDDDFVWMMDDIYFIKPVTIEDLATPRTDRWHGGRGNSWQRRKFNTMALLQSLGKTTHDFATHLPHHVEKDKLRAMYDEHNLHHNTLLWEVLYGNLFRESPSPSRPFFARFNKRMPQEQYELRCVNASIMNHTAGAWCVGIRSMFELLLPNPSKTEIENVPYVPQFKRTTAVQRTVKRRPKHTHRAYIDRQNKNANATLNDNSGDVQ